MSGDFWRKALSGGISYRKALSGVLKIAKPPPATLEAEVAAALEARPLPLRVILAERDATAVAARVVWESAPYRHMRERSGRPIGVDTDSHTFARPGDAAALLAATLKALRSL
jgi:hypothetical protein